VARVLVVCGPNLNLLGEREPEVYGRETLEDVAARLREAGGREDVSVDVFQSNSEGAIIDRLHAARREADAVVLNAGALSHYSYALRDAIAAIKIPVVEVHMTNVAARERFRRRSVLSPVCAGVVHGFGANSFLLGLRAAIDLIRR
jgi:3-dehydroquinate dehydratase II